MLSTTRRSVAEVKMFDIGIRVHFFVYVGKFDSMSY